MAASCRGGTSVESRRRRMKVLLRRNAAKIATLAVVATFYALAAPSPASSDGEPQALAKGIEFAAAELNPAANGKAFKSIRAVHPAVRHIDGWISAVGASVAFGDVSNSGRPADICLVDPRNDSVTVMPAPGTGDRFAPFSLEAPLSGYKPET